VKYRGIFIGELCIPNVAVTDCVVDGLRTNLEW